jgi:hypothetical protein
MTTLSSPADELASFINHVQRQDVNAICDANSGLADCATILMANQSVGTGDWATFPLSFWLTKRAK